MNRRNLIKSGILITLLSLLGIDINKRISSTNIELPKEIKIPKQKKPYDIYAPMPFDLKLLNQMKDINKKFRKSQIKTVYNNIPYPLFYEFEENFQGYKGDNPKIKNFNDFAQYVKYAKDLGFNFVYLLNSPRPFVEHDFRKHEKRFFNLIDKLEGIGCKEFKIANTQLIDIFSRKRPHLHISASTSFEFHNISQYENLFQTYPQIKSVNTSIDDNRNYTLLKNLKRKFPNIDIEVMVNEPCIHGCPARISHASCFFATWPCLKIREKIGELKYFLKNNAVYPWWLPYYQDIGINTFKFFSPTLRANLDVVDFLDAYMNCIENGIGKIRARDFFNDIYCVPLNIKNNVKLTEIMDYLPKIEHFIEKGDKCANICGIDCNYCTSSYEKLVKILGC